MVQLWRRNIYLVTSYLRTDESPKSRAKQETSAPVPRCRHQYKHLKQGFQRFLWGIEPLTIAPLPISGFDPLAVLFLGYYPKASRQNLLLRHSTEESTVVGWKILGSDIAIGTQAPQLINMKLASHGTETLGGSCTPQHVSQDSF